ncbi:hypothetical protein BGZ58_002281 [Dissophora ornata]|nr:hypothetical protein BGZ58_002281 [Dissophora ornata]
MQWIPFYASSLSTGGIDEEQRTATLLSLRHFPRESDVATMYSAYFVSYLICDLLLGVIYYRAYLDPLSGWFHHLGYLSVVSNATLQKNVSTLFAIGTPIEVSTIFLASGHIFPKLRSDFLFATSFFLSRIVYPIVLIPELYLNVESRLCWKVSLMALMVHIHWFRKFVQQQIRYYQESQQEKTSQQSQEPTPVPVAKKDDAVINECSTPAITTIVPDIQVAVTTKAIVESTRNDMSDMDEALANAAEVNGSRRQYRPKVIRRRSRPSFEHSIDSLCDDDESEDLDNETITTTVTATNTTEAPAKTMKQLLDECEQEEFAYPLRVGTGNNKTFSAAALKKLMQNQGSSLESGSEPISNGVVRLSRASSMRDSKRRIALDAVRFEDPQAHPQQARPKSVMFERRRQEQEQQHDDGEATVVLRRRPSRNSVAMANPSAATATENFGTIRMARGVAVQA